MPPKKKCWTKPKKDGGTYTTCKEGQDKPKEEEKPKKKIKFRVKPKEEEKEEKPKKRVFIVKGKAKAKPANKPQHAKVIEPKKRVANVAKVIPATKSKYTMPTSWDKFYNYNDVKGNKYGEDDLTHIIDNVLGGDEDAQRHPKLTKQHKQARAEFAKFRKTPEAMDATSDTQLASSFRKYMD